MITAVIIPALNEAGNIGDLVRDALRQPALGQGGCVIVVDNDSTDETAARAAEAGAQVVHEPRRGYGYACAAGAEAAERADLLLFLDGDYSSLPEEMERLLAPIRDGSADLVIGSRTRGHIAAGAMPPHQRFGNWLASRIMRLLYRVDVTDLGPYRAIRRDALRALHMREMTYGWPTEMMVKAARQGLRMREVAVSYHPRRTGQSKVSGTLAGSLLAGYSILSVTLRYAFFDKS